MLLAQRKFNHDTEPAPHTIVEQNSQVLRSDPNIYGDANSFNIKMGNISGGGQYVQIYDGMSQVLTRGNNAGGTDITITVAGTDYTALNRYTTVTYDKYSKLLTLTGAVDTLGGVQVTRQETYKFISDHIIENTLTFSVDTTGAQLSMPNYLYYASKHAVWNMGSTNFPDNNTNTLPLGMGVQLVTSGPVYGCISDQGYNNKNSVLGFALASQLGIACQYIQSSAKVTLVPSSSFSLKQWIFKSSNSMTDFINKNINAIAVAKGFKGTSLDRVTQVSVYINMQLMTDLTTVKQVPSFNYQNNGMYMRDSFWPLLTIPSTLEQSIITNFENNQQGTGQIPTSLNTSSGLGTLYHDESTMLYMIRAWYDKTVRGLNVNNTVLANALTYIANQVTNDQYVVNNTQGLQQTWMDLFPYTNGKYSGYNQGLYCVALLAAQALGLSVTQTQINNAITQYQALYNASDAYIYFTNNTTYVSPDVLIGEALANFFFNTKLLTDTMVNNHVAKLRAVNTIYGVPDICNSDGTYIALALSTYAQGDYQRGGSWFLYEYLAYYAAKYHGNVNAQSYIDSREAIELNVTPVSHEYLQTAGGLANPGDEPRARHMYSWNAASITIK